MAEDFQTSNWWKTSRNRGRVDTGIDYDGVSPATSNVARSTAISDPTGAQFAWPAATRPLMDSTLQLSGFGLSSPSMDWSQNLISGRGENSFQAMLQEDHESSSSTLQMKHINHPVFFDNSTSSSSSSSMMQGFMENESRHEQSLFDSQQLFHYQQQSGIVNHLQFTNNAPFWNASSFSQTFDLPIKGLEGGQEKKSSSEPAMKKIRVETASTLPTFKVRKEKLGDRITALQQLVSPFGKTDTASVLHEAIEYIKFLHDQVSVLSTPYLKNGHPMQQQQQSSEKFEEGDWQKQDLRSRGLCLVPISSTYPVATETNADFWTPTFGGAYR